MRNGQLLSLALLLAMGCGKGKDNKPNEVTPVMTFADISLQEGTGTAKNAEIKLKLDHSSSKQVSVTYTTIDGTATGGNDFTAASSQAIVFAPGETEKQINIAIVTDNLKEADETFQVRIQDAVNVSLSKGTATITLSNDDSKIGFNNSGYEAPASYPGYTLAWSDEFSGTSLAADAWSNESGDGCPGLCGWGNNELQYYTLPPNNLYLQDGMMIIEARAETYGGKNYTSTRIKTQGKKTFQYGRIDIRAMLPKGKGIWPAFWLLPQDNVYGNWPTSGEIDMMEAIGSEPSKVLGTAHYGPGPNSTYISKNYSITGPNFNDQFHVFSLEWKEDQIKWYVDNVLYSTIVKADIGSNTYPFNEKFYLIVNLAVGGNLPGSPDASTSFPQWLILDYIRVFQE